MMGEVITLNGEVINIGPWDYKLEPVVKDKSTLTPEDVAEAVKQGRNPTWEYDEEGNVVMEETNPLPEGAVVENCEVVTMADGGKCVAGDHIKLRKYPSVEEQLDYIYHHGLDAWKTDIIDPIKNEFPKQ